MLKLTSKKNSFESLSYVGSTNFCGIRDQILQRFWDQGSKFDVKKWDQSRKNIPRYDPQMPHQLLLKYLSSKTNFVFNQTLNTLFREICRDDTFKLLLKTLLKELFTDKGVFVLVNPSNPAKTKKNSRAYYVRTRDKSGSNSPPLKRNVQIPPSPGTMHSQMPGVCPGGMLKFRIDRRIM